MALDNQIDNQGIKKGLGLVVSQLIQSNQKLGQQETGNIFKELRLNNQFQEKLLAEKLKDDTAKERILDQAPEIAADIIISRKQIKQQNELNRNDASDDLLKAMAVTLTDQFKTSNTYYAESLNILALSNEHLRAELAISSLKAEKEITIGDLPSMFLKGVTDLQSTQKKLLSNALAKVGKSMDDLTVTTKKDTKQRSEDSDETTKKITGKLSQLGLKLNVGSILTKTLTASKKYYKNSKDILSKGFSGLKKTFGMILNNPFGTLLKVIALALATAGVFKFFASPEWRKMKPNIAGQIASALEGADKLFKDLVHFIGNDLLPILRDLASGIMFAINYIAELTGIKSKNVRGEIDEQVRKDLPGHDESVIQAEINKRVRLERKKFLAERGEFFNQEVKIGLMSQKFADKELAREMREFDANTYGGIKLGDKIVLDKESKMLFDKMNTAMSTNYATAVKEGDVQNNTTIQRFYERLKNDSKHSNNSNDQN